ncbi:MAG: dihydroorotase [bacterium JZ-2024 1]
MRVWRYFSGWKERMKYWIDSVLMIDLQTGQITSSEIRISHGLIEEVGKNLYREGYERIRAKGLYAAPGCIDLHTHLRQPGQSHKEEWETFARACANGGVTTAVTMANTIPPVDNPEIFLWVHQNASHLPIRILQASTITQNRGNERLVNLEKMYQIGARVFSDDGTWVTNSALMHDALLWARNKKVLLVSHCEDPTLSRNNSRIPFLSEVVAVNRDLLLAWYTQSSLHLAHLSCRESVALLHQAKKRGVKVSAEVTLHHLLFTEKDAPLLPRKGKVNPPLGSEADRKALQEAIASGIIDVVVSDHAPHEEISVEENFYTIPPGFSSLDVFFPAGYTACVVESGMDLVSFLRCVTLHPARLLGLPPAEIAPGKEANLILFCPEERQIISPQDIHSKGKNCPYIGKKLYSPVYWTIAQGKVIKQDGKVVVNL